MPGSALPRLWRENVPGRLAAPQTLAEETFFVNATLRPIGWIKTPYQTLRDCPRNVDPAGPVCELLISEDYAQGATCLTAGQEILVLYWFEQADRDVLLQAHRKTGKERGVFALRTPNRPNPIAAAVVTIEHIQPGRIRVRGLDCLDGTPLIDIKPAVFRAQSDQTGKQLIG